jgi:hypothetical protein
MARRRRPICAVQPPSSSENGALDLNRVADEFLL